MTLRPTRNKPLTTVPRAACCRIVRPLSWTRREDTTASGAASSISATGYRGPGPSGPLPWPRDAADHADARPGCGQPVPTAPLRRLRGHLAGRHARSQGPRSRRPRAYDRPPAARRGRRCGRRRRRPSRAALVLARPRVPAPERARAPRARASQRPGDDQTSTRVPPGCSRLVGDGWHERGAAYAGAACRCAGARDRRRRLDGLRLPLRRLAERVEQPAAASRPRRVRDAHPDARRSRSGGPLAVHLAVRDGGLAEARRLDASRYRPRPPGGGPAALPVK